LPDAVDKIEDGEKLKIFISGHGGTGIQFITDNDKRRKVTVDDLATLLEDGLKNRATSMGASANTEVSMVCCLFRPDSRWWSGRVPSRVPPSEACYQGSLCGLGSAYGSGSGQKHRSQNNFSPRAEHRCA